MMSQLATWQCEKMREGKEGGEGERVDKVIKIAMSANIKFNFTI